MHETSGAWAAASSTTSLPLQGKRILVTRAREQAGALSDRLRELGAIPVEFPTIHIIPPEDWAPLDDALKRLCACSPPIMDFNKLSQISVGADLSRPAPIDRPSPGVRSPGEKVKPHHRGTSEAGRPPIHRGTSEAREAESYYAWLVFTSANGVNICFDRLGTLAYNAQDIGNVRVAAIGPATAQALRRHGVKPDLVPGEYIAEGVAAALIEDAHRHGESLEGKRILIVRAAEARKVLVEELQRAGAIVEEVAAYRTRGAVIDNEQGHEVLRLLQSGQLDILTFTSSSTVRHFVQWLADWAPGAAASPIVLVTHNPQLKIACIGPITSRTARELGLDVQIEASEFTIDGLVEAIVQHEETYDRTDDSDTA
jgi:uroporphyrinogen-III synthase